jgi:GT2 family glycosyltransferase
MIPCAIVVPSKYPDIFAGCQESIAKFSADTSRILVRDGNEIKDAPDWITIQGAEPFCYARNVNLGMKAVRGWDILCMNDDVRLLQRDTAQQLQMLAYSDPTIGILSPSIKGGVDQAQQRWTNLLLPPISYTTRRLAFVCVYIKRSVIDTVGYLDENFLGYGYDDDDYCDRVIKAGFKLAIANGVVVRHGDDKLGESSNSFNRRFTHEEIGAQLERARSLYNSKHQ